MPAIVRMDDCAHTGDPAMRRERAQRVTEQRLAGERQVLLGQRRAEPRAAPRRYHQRNAGGHAATLKQAASDCQGTGTAYSRATMTPNINVLYGVLALAALVPAAALRLRARDERDKAFWAGLALAIVGPVAWAVVQLWGAWRTGFAVSLWLTIAVTTVLFAGLSLATRQAWRLTPILVPYLVGLGVI